MNPKYALDPNRQISYRQSSYNIPALNGFDSLERARVSNMESSFEGFSPNPHYASYMNIHKVFVGDSGAEKLIEISNALKDEWLPDYLNVAGWAAAEASLVSSSRTTIDRMELMDQAEVSWQNALAHQSQLTRSAEQKWLCEDTDEFRLALNLAYSPLMKSIIAGNVTKKVRHDTFVDTLAIAQLSAIQLELASKEGNIDAVGDHLGFGHECNALLAFLYANDPNYLPIPSSYRAGSGYEYRNQTHDISIINQHWGDIQKVFPVEVKAAASIRDRQRYKALIVRGKMHLAVTGRHKPIDTTSAFARVYSGEETEHDTRTVRHASSTVRDLLDLYQKGERPPEFIDYRTRTHFHETTAVAKKYKELSPDGTKK